MGPNQGNGSVKDSGDILLESHEDRLQSVERGVSACNEGIALASVRLDGLGQQVVEGNAAVLEKIHSGFASVHRRLGDGEAAVAGLSGTLQSQGRDVADLKSKSAGKELWLRRARKVSIGAGLTVLGAAASHFGDALWTWLTR